MSDLVGEALGRVELADVRLQRGVTTPPPDSNLLRNADFKQGVDPWLPLRVEAPAQATLKVGDTPLTGVKGKVAHISVG